MWRYFVLRLFISFVLFISLDKLWAQDFTDSEARDCTDLTEIEGRGGENMIIANPLSHQESLVNMRVEMLVLDI